MSGAQSDRDALARENEALARRVERLRRFGAFRRALRAAETVEDVASVSVEFATRDLGFASFVVYCAERDDVDFGIAGSATNAPAEVIERSSPLAVRLATESQVQGVGPLADLAAATNETAIALALRASPEKLIGIAIAVYDRADAEILEELAFDVESALSARVMMHLRAEELAVLEVQERELVGLLRDVQERDTIIRQDLEEARRFQQKMLGSPPRVAGVTIEVVYTPLNVVGGDLYAVSPSSKYVRLFIADATGHGVRAALTTMFIKSGYDALTARTPNPAALLEALNDDIARAYGSAEMLFSAACVDVDLETGRVAYASAAHPPLCIVNGGEARLVESGGAFLGLRTRMRFEAQYASLERGDAVYLLTDGFSEACNDAGEQFGDEQVRATIERALASATRAGVALSEAVAAHAVGGALADDATLLGLVFGVEDPTPRPSVRLTGELRMGDR